ncbi:divergent PAP2 family protein [Pseudoflavonifractor sp. 524-17]|uniref:divergent PAP2 family protein n=1 Tax=Pseudoflavonifractor sp. 524-17 TaxID=2304577 RepID=UPI00137B8818|nr:divergent PAP2 family protein [Pseudoflavonifractor sp. 524-17]NCE64287.1 divergent PAP2 family protein [Pseudoflavonifractor sp. 524-17]
MNVTDVLTGNIILNLSILAWALAQILKVMLVLITKHRWDWRHILSSGGMPSSHSAFVSACAGAVGMMQGFGSVSFAIAAVVAIVVMYDASNVRRAAGEQAKILNYIMDHWKEMRPEFFGKELKELLGHTPFQVLMGGLLGVVVGVGGMYLLKR